MEKIVLENEELYVEINSFGAELSRIKNKKNDKEYLWNADEKYWKRHSPVLFPFVGSLKDKKYKYDGKEYFIICRQKLISDTYFEGNEALCRFPCALCYA